MQGTASNHAAGDLRRSVQLQMCDITLSLPEESLLALKLDAESAGSALRLAAAMKFYELGRLSSGAAARLAGIPRTLFLTKLADFGIDTFRLTPEELREDLSNA